MDKHAKIILTTCTGGVTGPPVCRHTGCAWRERVLERGGSARGAGGDPGSVGDGDAAGAI